MRAHEFRFAKRMHCMAAASCASRLGCRVARKTRGYFAELISGLALRTLGALWTHITGGTRRAYWPLRPRYALGSDWPSWPGDDRNAAVNHHRTAVGN